jgi:hypothetical protein
MKGSRVKPLGIGQEIEVGLMGDNPRLDPIHRDGFPLAARKALHRRRCASAILARPAVVFGPVDSPILSFPLQPLRPHNARTRLLREIRHDHWMNSPSSGRIQPYSPVMNCTGVDRLAKDQLRQGHLIGQEQSKERPLVQVNLTTAGGVVWLVSTVSKCLPAGPLFAVGNPESAAPHLSKTSPAYNSIPGILTCARDLIRGPRAALDHPKSTLQPNLRMPLRRL